MPKHAESKLCPTCGREITWRKKWEKNWPEVKYCSAACRRGARDTDQKLEQAILALLDERAPGATICPSEAAKKVGGDAWRNLMQPARSAGRRLAHRGILRFTQNGKPIDPANIRGPVRLQRPAVHRPGKRSTENGVR